MALPNPLGKVCDDQNPGCKSLTDRKSAPTLRVPPMSEKGACTVTELKAENRNGNRQERKPITLAEQRAMLTVAAETPP
jgi:hypothetical protein